MSNYHIEEAGYGKPSDSIFIVVDPTADVAGILECCKRLCAPEIKKVWIVFDAKCQPMLVQTCLKVIKDVIPGREYVIRHVDGFYIMLMGQLWRRMQAYSEKRGE